MKFARAVIGFLCISPAIAYAPRAVPRLMRSFKSKTSRWMSTSEEKKDTGHMAPGGSEPPKMSEEDERLLMAYRDHQSKAARLSMAEEVRTLIDQSIGFGVLATNSDQYAGYPTGSVVGFALEDDGLPFFVFSTMSAHTKDVLKDSRCSLTVMSKDFQGAAEGRVVLIGDAVKVFDKELVAKLRAKYLARHKDAYWIDFGDFSYFAMKSIQTVRFVGGFAMAGSVTPEAYQSAAPDPIAAFAGPVMKHMNDDHADSTVAMVKHYVGIPCSEAQIVSLDRLGMVVKAKLEVAGGGYSKIRLPFPSAATDRKSIKELLVEMTQASASA